MPESSAFDYSAMSIDEIHRRLHDLHALQSELQLQNEQLRAILNAVTDPIITIDRQGVILSANPATERVFGYEVMELVGKNIRHLMPSPYHEEHGDYLKTYFQTGRARLIGSHRELCALRKDQSIFPIELSVSEIDHLGCFIGVIRDISERKALQSSISAVLAEEQRRIALELHDGIAGELTGLLLMAKVLVKNLSAMPQGLTDSKPTRHISEDDFHRLLQITENLRQKLSEATQHTRLLSHGIMPVQVDVEGLQAALAELARATNELGCVKCHFNSPADVRMTDTITATELYRIAQEAVTNALRHSGGDTIEIVLDEHDQQIVLEVSDNGTSHCSHEGQSTTGCSHSGLGIKTMHHRASLIGGILQIEPHDEGGTLVRCTLPSHGGYGRNLLGCRAPHGSADP